MEIMQYAMDNMLNNSFSFGFGLVFGGVFGLGIGIIALWLTVMFLAGIAALVLKILKSIKRLASH